MIDEAENPHANGNLTVDGGSAQLQHPGIMDLPTEVRLRIYEYTYSTFPNNLGSLYGSILEVGKTTSATAPFRRSYLAPLYVCRTFYIESRELAFSNAYHVCRILPPGNTYDAGGTDLLRWASRLSQPRRELVRSLEIPPTFAWMYAYPKRNVAHVHKYADHWDAGLVNLEQLVLRCWAHRELVSDGLIETATKNAGFGGKLKRIFVVPEMGLEDRYWVDRQVRIHPGFWNHVNARNILTHATELPQLFRLLLSDWLDQHTFIIKTRVGHQVHHLSVTYCMKIQLSPNLHFPHRLSEVPRSVDCRIPGCQCEHCPHPPADHAPVFRGNQSEEEEQLCIEEGRTDLVEQ